MFVSKYSKNTYLILPYIYDFKFILGLSNAIRLIDLNKEQNSGMSIKGGREQ